MAQLIRFCILILFITSSFLGKGQYYRIGENPASTKWRQIKSDHFQVIYPESYEEQAQAVSNTLQMAYQFVGASLNHQPKKISVILQAHTADHNGFVTWAPKRAELYVLPPQNNDQTDWLTNLVIHEYRHVVQIDNLNKGVTKALYYILGEQGVGLVLGLTTPLWFLEGDATGAETAFSHGGRGRVADFNIKLRAQLVEIGSYKYDKAQFGSFKHIIPNQYELGYHLTTYAKSHYGHDVWARIFHRIGTMPLTPFRFSTAVKKETGLSSKKFYIQAIDSLKHQWTTETQKIQENKFTAISKSPRIPTDYTFPVPTSHGVVAIKRGLGDVTQFTLINNKEKTLLKTGSFDRIRLHGNNDILVWSEIYPDIRWNYRSYSNIMTYDVKTRKKKKITVRKRLYAPALNLDGTKIIAVAVDSVGKQSLYTYDRKSKAEHTYLPIPLGEIYKFTVWKNDSIVYVIKYSGEQKNQIISVNLHTSETQTLFSQPQKISELNLNDDMLFYRSSKTGIDNIHTFNLLNQKETQVTEAKFGAFSPTFYNDTLYYANYTSHGYELVKTGQLLNKEIELQQHDVLIHEKMIEGENGFSLRDSLPNDSFVSSKYRKGLHLINLHSWQPVAYDFGSENPPTIGFSLLSQNKLSSTVTVVGGGRNEAENKNFFNADIQYYGLYPALTFGYFYTKRFGLERKVIIGEDTNITSYTFRNDGLKTSIGLPFGWNKGNYIYRLTPQINAKYENVRIEGDVNAFFQYVPLTGSLFFLRQSRTSKRDIQPRWKQSGSLSLRKSANIGKVTEKVLYGYGSFYFPGGGKHQGIKSYYAYQHEYDRGVGFTSYIRFPRGYSPIRSETIHSLQFDWVTPLIHPDWNASFLAYFQRVKLALFYDHAFLARKKGELEINSTGFELTTDVNLLRYYFLLDIGFRTSYRITTEDTFTEILIKLGI